MKIAHRAHTATRLVSSTSTMQSSINNQQQESTILWFKRHKADQAKMRLSLKNISDSKLHFRFKKWENTTMAIDPRSMGVLEPHGSNDLTISWDFAKQKPSRRGITEARMILQIAIDGKFDDPDNAISISTRLHARLTQAKFDANAPAAVLVVDSPKNVHPSTARSSISVMTCLPYQASPSEPSMEEFDDQERRRFNWIYLAFILLTVVCFFVNAYCNWKQQHRAQINNAK